MSDDDLQLVRITVNGVAEELAVSCRRSLADVLRHDLGLTGTHVGCEHGICGACTVLLDGEPVRACLVLGVQADDAEVATVEGLAADPAGARVQEAFVERRAYQCGFCTPGFLMLARWLADREPGAGADRIRDVAASNVCRCTGYQAILDAFADAVGER